MTFATQLTLARILLIIPFTVCFFIGSANAQWAAAVIFIIAGITDYLDGYVARKYNQTSALGAALDPIADKLLTGAGLLLLAMMGTLSGLHIIAALAILLREILISGLREAVAKREGVAFPVTQLAKWKTTFQFVAMAILIAPVAGHFYTIGISLFWLAAALTVWTGYGYVKVAVTALSNNA